MKIDCKKNDSVSLYEVDDYWTPERMLAAKPAELLVLTDKEYEEQTRNREALAVIEGAVQVVPGYSPELETVGVVERADVGDRPFYDGGKLLYTDSNGDDWSGSAQFVGNKRCLMTAAHCLHDPDTKQWNTNFRFVRAYDNGDGQSVGWMVAAIYEEWYSAGSPKARYDYGFIYTLTESTTEYLGYKTLLDGKESWTSIGYPENFGNGEHMYKVVGTKGTVEDGLVKMNDNPFGHGASGGAWIGDAASGIGGNFAIGLNSFGREKEPNVMYGPLFDSDTTELLRYVMGGGCS